MSDSMRDQEILELRANDQRRRVNALVEALDARRHPRHSPVKLNGGNLAAAILAGLGAIGFAVARSGATSRKTQRQLTAASAVLGAASLAVGAASTANTLLGKQPTALAAVNPPRRVTIDVVPTVPQPQPRPLPLLEGPATKPVHRRAWFWVLAVFAVIVFGIGVALDPIAAMFVQKGLDQGLTGYHGSFSKVHVSIIPIKFEITDLSLVQDGMDQKDQLVAVKHLEARAKWSNLLTGKIVATAAFDHAAFRVLFGQAVAPPEAVEAGKEAAKKVKEENLDIGKILHELIPFRVDRIEMKDSEVTLIDATDPKRPTFWINDIEMVVENITSRELMDRDAPLMLTGRATVAKTGVLKLLFVADLLDVKPGVTGQAQLTGLKLESLYQWAAAKAGVSPHGTVNVFVNANTGKGALKGDVKVMARDVHVDGLETVGDKLKALGANIAFKILADKEENRTVATTLPLRGSLDTPDVQIWPTILGVVRNAFVDTLNWGFGDLPVKTAPKKEGVIEQIVNGLDGKKEGVKAQPLTEQQKKDAKVKKDDDAKKKAEDDKKKAEEDKKKKDDEAKKKAEEDKKKKEDEEKKKADEAKKKADEEQKKKEAKQ